MRSASFSGMIESFDAPAPAAETERNREFREFTLDDLERSTAPAPIPPAPFSGGELERQDAPALQTEAPDAEVGLVTDNGAPPETPTVPGPSALAYPGPPALALPEAPADPVAAWSREQEVDRDTLLLEQGGDLQQHIGPFLLLGQRQIHAGRVAVEVPDQVALRPDPQSGLQRGATRRAIGGRHELPEVDRVWEQHAGQPAVAHEPEGIVVLA